MYKTGFSLDSMLFFLVTVDIIVAFVDRPNH